MKHTFHYHKTLEAVKATPYTVSDYIAERLKEMGLKDMFIVPGDFMTPFLDIIEERHPDIKLINAPNELCGGYAADAYTRISGFGAVSVTYGVGAFSLINGIAASWVERNPVVFLNGHPSTSDMFYENELGVLIHHSTGNFRSNKKAYEDITAAAVTISNIADAPALIDEAIVACYINKRPVYIECYKDVWQMPCNKPTGKLDLTLTKSDPVQLDAAVSMIIARLEAAKKPIVWAGIELQRYHIQKELESLLTTTNLGYITTLLAKSLLPETNPHFVGTYTGAASSAELRERVNTSDFLLCLGTIITDDYLDIINSSYGKMAVAYDGGVRVGYQHFPNVYTYDLLPALIKKLKATKYKSPLGKTAKPKGLLDDPDEGTQITFNGFFRRMENFVTKDMMLLVDESDSMYVVSDLIIKEQNGFASEAAWGSIGAAAPMAVGISLASGKRAVAFCGDGGFQMVDQALSFLNTNCPGTIIFVMNNNLYGIEQALVDLAPFDGKGEFRAYNILPQWQYYKLADVMGGKGYRATTYKELDKVLAEVKKNTKTLSVVQIDIPMTDLPPQIRRLASM